MVSSHEISKKLKSPGYLVCESCGGFYELQTHEKYTDFDKCHCGSKLKYKKVLETPEEKEEKIKIKKSLSKIDELMGNPIKKDINNVLGRTDAILLKKTLSSMVKDGKSFNEIESFFIDTINDRVNINQERDRYAKEAKNADILYKSYVTDGVSRLDKVNGRFLASQTLKMDKLIEQNDKIINLLEELLKRDNGFSTWICNECGTRNDKNALFCEECGNKLLLD